MLWADAQGLAVEAGGAWEAAVLAKAETDSMCPAARRAAALAAEVTTLRGGWRRGEAALRAAQMRSEALGNDVAAPPVTCGEARAQDSTEGVRATAAYRGSSARRCRPSGRGRQLTRRRERDKRQRLRAFRAARARRQWPYCLYGQKKRIASPVPN